MILTQEALEILREGHVEYLAMAIRGAVPPLREIRVPYWVYRLFRDVADENDHVWGRRISPGDRLVFKGTPLHVGPRVEFVA